MARPVNAVAIIDQLVVVMDDGAVYRAVRNGWAQAPAIPGTPAAAARRRERLVAREAEERWWAWADRQEAADGER